MRTIQSREPGHKRTDNGDKQLVYLYVTYPYHVSFLLYTRVNKRGQTKKRSQNAFLCRTVKQLVDKKQTLILTTSDIWYKVMAAMDGRTIPGHPLSLETKEFGVRSQSHKRKTRKSEAADRRC